MAARDAAAAAQTKPASESNMWYVGGGRVGMVTYPAMMVWFGDAVLIIGHAQLQLLLEVPSTRLNVQRQRARLQRRGVDQTRRAQPTSSSNLSSLRLWKGGEPGPSSHSASQPLPNRQKRAPTLPRCLRVPLLFSDPNSTEEASPHRSLDVS